MSLAYLVFDRNTTENLRDLQCVVNLIASLVIDTFTFIKPNHLPLTTGHQASKLQLKCVGYQLV